VGADVIRQAASAPDSAVATACRARIEAHRISSMMASYRAV
jgi:hypothetical protein